MDILLGSDFIARMDAIIRRLNAREITLEDTPSLPPLEPIDIELDRGVEVTLADVSPEQSSGLLSFRGRQVLVYMPDHVRKTDALLDEPGTLHKFHVAECRHLEKYRRQNDGLFNARYTATNNVTGRLPVVNVGPVGEKQDGETRLHVCKLCLAKLNYKNYRHNKAEVFRSFSLNDFFTVYSTYFARPPKGLAAFRETGYTEDWDAVSRVTREAAGHRCEGCKVVLTGNPALLHVHHKNGVKQDNAKSNLMVLCIDCHRKQPGHGRMFVTRDQMQVIGRLRREQGLVQERDWSMIFKYADTSVHGLIHEMQRAGWALPRVGYEILSDGRVVCEVELAWPDELECVVTENENITLLADLGWTVYTPQSLLDLLAQA